MALNQNHRLLSLTTPLGDNKLVLTGFRGREEISRLFKFELDMISDDNAVSAKDIVGQKVTFSIKQPDDSLRHFHGYVASFWAGDVDHKGRRNYRALVVPWLWLLSRTSDCRIFQEMTVPEIIEQVFSDLGFSDYDLSNVGGTHPTRDYCVQYRETDFNFVSRLMEEEGMFYFFKHEDGKHTLVLADQKSGYAQCDPATVDFPTDTGSRAIEDYISNWEHRYEYQTGKWAQTDYNFETPKTSLMATENTVMEIPGTDKYEFYDYPGVFANSSDGRDLTKVRMEEIEAGHDVVTGKSLCKSFATGHKFKIGQHKDASEVGKSYILTVIEHFAFEPMAYETGAPGNTPYRNNFTCIPDSTVFRAERITHRPFVQGPQTAVVVGPPGEEIYTDKYGRIKVQFHWDREGQNDDHSSCWIRVAQFWAGQKWGAHFWPRIGHEVVVSFLEGNPDKPLVIGSVYNDANMPPYELPEHQTRSGIKTRSSKGGDASNFNEIRFEDKKGEEQLYVHAERNRDIEVEADETHWVGGNQKMDIDKDRTTHVFGHFTETVDKGVERTVSKGEIEKVIGGVNRTVTDSETEMILGGVTRIVADSGEIEVVCGGEMRVVDGGETEIVNGAETRLVVGNHTEIITGALNQVILGGGLVVSPAGHKIIAPSDLYTTGTFNGSAFVMVQSNFASRLSIRGIDVRLTSLKFDTVGVLCSNVGVDVRKRGLSLKSGALSAATFGLALWT